MKKQVYQNIIIVISFLAVFAAFNFIYAEPGNAAFNIETGWYNSCPAGWVNTGVIDEDNLCDGGHSIQEDSAQCNQPAYLCVRHNLAPLETGWYNFCPAGWVDTGIVDGDNLCDGAHSLQEDSNQCNQPENLCLRHGVTNALEVAPLQAGWYGSCPAGWVDTGIVDGDNLCDGAHSLQEDSNQCNQPVNLCLRYELIPTGTININATLNGSPWSGSFVIDATHNGTLYPNVAITAPNVNSGVPTGSYALAYKSGGPPSASLASVTPSATQTLSAGGTITFIFNFVTAPPSTGTININATLNGAPWSGSFVIDATHNGTLYPNVAIIAPNVNPGVPIGSYTLAYKSGGPAGATLSGITPSATQTLSANGTITFTFNFITTAPPPPTLIVSPSSASVNVGGAQQFNAVYDPDGSGPQFPLAVTNSSLWSSSNNSVATVSSVGVATGASAGSVTITASYAGMTASALFTVIAPIPSLTVVPSSASVSMGGTQQFTATYDPDGSGPNPSQNVTATVVWSSSDATRVTVSGGLATRVGHGLALITASYLGLSDSADILDPAILRVAPASADLVSGETFQLVAWYDADGAGGPQAEQDVTASSDWSSSLPAIATVNNAATKGLVTAQTVILTSTANVRALYLGLSDVSRITVSPGSGAVPSISFTANPSSVNSGGSTTLTWTVTNADSCTASGGWSGAKSPSGGSESTGPLSGTTTFTLTCSNANGPSSVSVTITVAASLPPQPPSNLEITPSSLNTCGTVGLTWQDNANNEDQFELERDSGSGFAKIADIAANTTSFTDTAIVQNTSYSYRIRACNGNGCSAYSNVATGRNRSPSANFAWAPAQPKTNQNIVFSDTSVFFGGAGLRSRAWQFPGGMPATATSSPAQTKFSTVGQKTVRLDVVDTASRTCSVAKNVAVASGITPPDWEEVPPE